MLLKMIYFSMLDRISPHKISSYLSANKNTGINFIWRFLQIAGKQGITFLIFFIAARLLDPQIFGTYNYIMAFVFLFIIFCDFGVSQATSTLVARYSSQRHKDLSSLLFNSFLLLLGTVTLIFSIVYIVGLFFNHVFYDYFFFVLPLFFFIPATSLLDGYYRGLKQFKTLSIITIGTAVLAPFYIYIMIQQWQLEGALLSQVLYYGILFVALIAFTIPGQQKQLNTAIIRSIFSYSLIIGLSHIGYFLFTKVDVLILGQFGYITEIGYYEIINKVFQMTLLPVSILGTVVAPNTTKKWTNGSYTTLRHKVIRECMLLFAVGIGASGVLYFFLPYAVETFLTGYDKTLLLQLLSVIILLLPFRFFSSYVTVGYVIPSGLAKLTTTYLLITGTLNVIANYLFISWFGFIGVVYATVFSQLCYVAMKDVAFFRLLQKKITT